ncbi:hypothetical protein BpHYR1_004600 [Brachionus plicatilis]|uniref:Uncharacterized protein n=1 Tax=Brachionus plicatilis TaxID=10195 RepID=A0A3M7PC25_BRAPC|nr:hypothetical protein BpHYR1_004600 [Brachionus plicatilis]
MTNIFKWSKNKNSPNFFEHPLDLTKYNPRFIFLGFKMLSKEAQIGLMPNSYFRYVVPFQSNNLAMESNQLSNDCLRPLFLVVFFMCTEKHFICIFKPACCLNIIIKTNCLFHHIDFFIQIKKKAFDYKLALQYLLFFKCINLDDKTYFRTKNRPKICSVN